MNTTKIKTELQELLALISDQTLASKIHDLFLRAQQQVKKVIGKIMKFDQTITVPAGTTINLIEFYQEGRDDIKLSIGNNFKQLINECTENGKYAIVDISGEIIRQFKNNQSASDYKIMTDLQETFLNQDDDFGRLEMRKRLAITAYLMQSQQKGEEGVLQNNGNATIVGYPLMASGSMWRAFVNRSGVAAWHWNAYDSLALGWLPGHSFWSRNEPKPKIENP
jgi:uncharacterized ubiquitin-like protein YukD